MGRIRACETALPLVVLVHTTMHVPKTLMEAHSEAAGWNVDYDLMSQSVSFGGK